MLAFFSVLILLVLRKFRKQQIAKHYPRNLIGKVSHCIIERTIVRNIGNIAHKNGQRWRMSMAVLEIHVKKVLRLMEMVCLIQ